MVLINRKLLLKLVFWPLIFVLIVIWTSSRSKNLFYATKNVTGNLKTNLYGNFAKRMFSHSRVAYYSNSVATRQILLLSGDIELNPGPSSQCLDTRKDYLEQFVQSFDSPSTNLRIAHINIRSLRNKLDEI